MQLHEYQKAGRDFLLSRLERHSGAGLWFEPGLGKTVTTLDTITCLKHFYGYNKILIVAPARVITTAWPKEIKNWSLPLSWGWLKGDEEERRSVVADDPDIFFVGCENLALRNLSTETKAKWKNSQMAEWILKGKNMPPIDLIVVDEVTKFKSWSANRSKVLRRMLTKIPKRITLTGTPVPSCLGDIFAQQFILDAGETLSPYIGRFRERFMRQCGFENREWEMRPEMQDTLVDLLKPWYLSGSAIEHLDMPKLIENEIDVILPAKALAAYKSMEREMFAELDSDRVVAISGGGKYNLCRQIAGGNAYDEDKNQIAVHDAKLDALEDLYEELNGKPLIVAYWFQHEFERIQKRFPHAAVIRGGTTAAMTKSIIADWQAGKYKMLIGQASTISHGVDGLQKGCNDLCWYTITDQPEVRKQLECRIYRQGATGDQVRIHYLLAVSTLDRTIKRVLDANDATQRDVMEAVRGMRNV
jgi:superfamily II DNA or RNA helicase